MMLNRQQAIGILMDFAGPLGPFESLDEKLERQEAFASSADQQIIDSFLNILVNFPVQDEIYPINQDSFEIVLSELLVQIGQHNPTYILEKIAPYLSNKQSRPTVIEVIGGLKIEEGINWLRPLLEDKDLIEDELVRLACALGEIGGTEAFALLQQLRISKSETMIDLHKEIDITIDNK